MKDKEKIDTKSVENIEKVQGAFFNAGQFQIIFGTGTVNRIYYKYNGLCRSNSKCFWFSDKQNQSIRVTCVI